jgi:hypothetical protein
MSCFNSSKIIIITSLPTSREYGLRRRWHGPHRQPESLIVRGACSVPYLRRMALLIMMVLYLSRMWSCFSNLVSGFCGQLCSTNRIRRRSHRVKLGRPGYFADCPVTLIKTLQQVTINYKPPFASRATVNLLPPGTLSSENRFHILLSKLPKRSTLQPRNSNNQSSSSPRSTYVNPAVLKGVFSHA